MTLLFVIDQVYIHGGIERVLSIKANYLALNPKNKIHIITTEQKNKEPLYSFNPQITFHDIDVNYHRNKSYYHPLNLIKLPKHILKLKKVIKKIKPSAIVVCSHSTDTYFIPFINKNIPKIKEFHFSKHIEKKYRLKQGLTLKKIFYKFADYVESKYHKLIVLNVDEKNYYKTSNVVVIPNPLTFYPETTSNLSHKVVIAAGRIAPVKGYDTLIDIWEIVSKKEKEWQLHIYGAGTPAYVQFLQDKINVKNLNKSILLKGATNAVEKKMLSSSLFAMTSHNECFPLVLLEAQACGLPIISFDCPHGPKNIITDNTGTLIPLYDKENYASSLLNMISNTKILKEMGKNSRINALNYSLEEVMGEWQKMFNSLLNPKS